MTDLQYFETLLKMDLSWIIGSYKEPTKYMTARHMSLHRLAIRRKSRQAYESLFNIRKA
jgi:hypothetical protein